MKTTLLLYHSPAFLPGTGLPPGLGFDKGDGNVEGVPGDTPGDVGDGLPGVPLVPGAKDSSSIITAMSSVEAFTSVIACYVGVRDRRQMLSYGVMDGYGWVNLPPGKFEPPDKQRIWLYCGGTVTAPGLRSRLSVVHLFVSRNSHLVCGRATGRKAIRCAVV